MWQRPSSSSLTSCILVQHTSCSLTINENASPDVPLDLADTLDRIVPEGRQYRHLDEGLDDMPAHVKVRRLVSREDRAFPKDCPGHGER